QRVRGDGGQCWLPFLLVQQTCPQVHERGGNFQRVSDLLQYFGAGFAQSTLDLAEVWLADPGLVGELSQRHFCVASHVSDEPAYVSFGHGATVTPSASCSKHSARNCYRYLSVCVKPLF